MDGTFTPFMMPATGEMGCESSNFYSSLSKLIIQKRGKNSALLWHWLREKNILALMKSFGMCIRGSRSVFHREKLEHSVKENGSLV